MKDHEEPINELDFVPFYEEISVEIPEGGVQDVKMHDGSTLRIRKLGHEYDPSNKMHALAALSEAEAKGEVLTGAIYLDTGKPNFIDMLNMADETLATLPQSKTRPPKEALDVIMEELR